MPSTGPECLRGLRPLPIFLILEEILLLPSIGDCGGDVTCGCDPSSPALGDKIGDITGEVSCRKSGDPGGGADDEEEDEDDEEEGGGAEDDEDEDEEEEEV